MHSDAVLFVWGGYDPLKIFYNYPSNYKGVWNIIILASIQILKF